MKCLQPTGEQEQLTDNQRTNFYYELHDTPSDPRAYGMAGWLENDRMVIDRRHSFQDVPRERARGAGSANQGPRLQGLERRRKIEEVVIVRVRQVVWLQIRPALHHQPMHVYEPQTRPGLVDRHPATHE